MIEVRRPIAMAMQTAESRLARNATEPIGSSSNSQAVST